MLRMSWVAHVVYPSGAGSTASGEHAGGEDGEGERGWSTLALGAPASDMFRKLMLGGSRRIVERFLAFAGDKLFLVLQWYW